MKQKETKQNGYQGLQMGEIKSWFNGYRISDPQEATFWRLNAQYK